MYVLDILSSRASRVPSPLMDRGAVNWAVVISSHLVRTLLEWSQKDD